LNAAGSSSGSLSTSTSAPRLLRTCSTLSPITVRLRRPKKSIFSRPICSIAPISNWVTMSPSVRCTGTRFVSGSRPITTPAAWIECWRRSPSSLRAVSITWRAVSSDS
jgi:hypothetical protein